MADHLIEEVDDALRRERLETFWKRAGHYVIAGSLGVILATAGIVMWQNFADEQRQDWTSAMLSAKEQLDEKHYDEAAATLTQAEENADGPLLAITRIWQGQTATKQRQPEKAQAALKAVSGAGVYHDYGMLLEEKISNASTHDAKGVFRFTSMERRASAALQEGREAEASELLGTIAEDALAPQSMRERAALLRDGLPAAATPSKE